MLQKRPHYDKLIDAVLRAEAQCLADVHHSFYDVLDQATLKMSPSDLPCLEEVGVKRPTQLAAEGFLRRDGSVPDAERAAKLSRAIVDVVSIAEELSVGSPIPEDMHTFWSNEIQRHMTRVNEDPIR